MQWDRDAWAFSTTFAEYDDIAFKVEPQLVETCISRKVQLNDWGVCTKHDSKVFFISGYRDGKTKIIIFRKFYLILIKAKK